MVPIHLNSLKGQLEKCLDTPKKQLEKGKISPDQGGYNPHTPTGAYISSYFPLAAVLSGVPDCLPSGNPVL